MSELCGKFNWAGRCLVSTLVLAMFGCADTPGRNDSTGTAQTTDRSSSSIGQAQDDVRFVATEEQGSKIWKATGATSSTNAGNMVTVNIQNRGSKPLSFKVVNMLDAEHGFAIDTMKVKEVLKPGEEKTISVPLANIDPSATDHRVYCQLHPKHAAATLVAMKDQPSASDRPATAPPAQGTGAAAGSAPGTQKGEVSSRLPEESEGQHMISEQSKKQREIESTSRTEQAPGSIDPKTCADFPGFDRGCPGGGTR
jgi:archaellum component FlaF (FlaF/FlaG flagellin family)